MKVLVIDDSQDALDVAKARLKMEGLEVICATSGAEGLKLAATQSPDLVLLGVDMPDICGFDLCRRLKADPQTCMIPVIFLTASEDAQDKVKGLDTGAVDYITKPFDAFELRARVRAALRTKHLQDLLIKYAQIDPVTELWNRRALMDRLQQEWSRIERHGGSLAFIMADVDHFKRINDRFGHHVGDRVLKEIAAGLVKHCRKADFPARFGGEEFSVVVPNSSADGAAALAERCREEIGRPNVDCDGRSGGVTVSFGVSDSKSASSPQELMDQADEALYRAKELGRNRVEKYDPAGPSDRQVRAKNSGPSQEPGVASSPDGCPGDGSGEPCGSADALPQRGAS